MNLTSFYNQFNNIGFVNNNISGKFVGGVLLSKLIFSILILILFVFSGYVFAGFFNRYLKQNFANFRTKHRSINPKFLEELNELRDSIKPSIIKFVIFLAIRFILDLFDLLKYPWNTIIHSLLIIFGAFVLVRVGGYFIKTFGSKITQKTETSLDDALLPLAQKIIQAIFIIWSVYWIFTLWKIDVTPLLGGLGLLGLAASFALKGPLENFFGAISLLMDESFRVGDRVHVQDINLDGTIQDIGLRSTKFLTWDNELILVPNSILANATIRNYVLPSPKERCVIDFDVAYGTDIDKVKEVILDVLNGFDFALDEPPREVFFKTMDAYALKFQARFWIKDVSELYGSKLKATDAIYRALIKHKLEIPFPTQTIHLKK